MLLGLCGRLSVDLAWDLLMDSKYSALQKVIYTNASELDRFRQLVVNVSFLCQLFICCLSVPLNLLLPCW